MAGTYTGVMDAAEFLAVVLLAVLLLGGERVREAKERLRDNFWGGGPPPTGPVPGDDSQFLTRKRAASVSPQ